MRIRLCKAQFEDGSLFNVVSRIRDWRFVAVDRERCTYEQAMSEAIQSVR